MSTIPRAPIVVIGPPGAGKSAVAAALAALLGRPLRDTDNDIETAAGKPVSHIFVDDGEQAFRDLERKAAIAALGDPGGVVALGSGAVLDPAVEQAMDGAVVVYLEADFGVVARQAGLDRPRIVLPGNPRGRLRALLEERRPVYERLATVTIAADDGAPDELAAQIARNLS